MESAILYHEKAWESALSKINWTIRSIWKHKVGVYLVIFDISFWGHYWNKFLAFWLDLDLATPLVFTRIVGTAVNSYFFLNHFDKSQITITCPQAVLATGRVVRMNRVQRSNSVPSVQDEQGTKATLILEDGTSVEGLSFGADKSVGGEVGETTNYLLFTAQTENALIWMKWQFPSVAMN